MKYSKDLINKTINYFKNKHNHITDEQKAEEYLDSMADLYEGFVEFTEKDKVI